MTAPKLLADDPPVANGRGDDELLVDERFDETGTVVRTWLSVDGEAIRLRAGDLEVSLPVEVLDKVMSRYGKPIADDVPILGPTLRWGEARALVRIRHRARYDVVAKDYLVLVRADELPLVELSTSIAGALVHLARAAHG